MSGALYADDPHEAFTWMRQNQPVCHDETNDIWGIASYQEVRALGTDPSLYSNAGGIRPKFPATPMMTEYMRPVMEQRRATGVTDDLIGILVNAELDGERLDEQAPAGSPALRERAARSVS